ncbi:MAG: transglycosylase SLT domain-containing protein [Elusimicrobia bacterium]|nr:transglycosylase SLT domain-containing protein [Elusimicrobiota bacterium]
MSTPDAARRMQWLSALSVSVFLCQALPASGGVTLSLAVPSPEDAAESETSVLELLSSPERTTEPGLVRYHAADWSARLDGASRVRLLAGLKARWGSALQVLEDAQAGGPAYGAPKAPRLPPGLGQAALSRVPASLLGGLHGQAYDNLGSGDRAEADVLPVPAPETYAAAGRASADARWALSAPDTKSAPQAKEFEDVVVELIDELSARDPALFAEIRAEEARIRSLPTHEERVAAVNAGYPLLERHLDRSAAEGKLSPKGAAKWAVFRSQAKAALADGTLFEKALFAGKAFDEKVQRLLDQGVTRLDPHRKLPEKRDEYMRLSRRIHEKLAVPGNSTALTTRRLDEAFGLVGKEFGIRPEFLKYMAKTESGLRQTVPSNPAAVGIMQIENVHKEAYSGARNVANDTITNIVYGGLLRAQTDRTIAKRFSEAGLALPSNPRVVEFMGDLAYNRGPGLLKYIAQFAAQQKIDVDDFAEYVGGPGGSYKISDDGQRVTVIPGPGTDIDKTGKNSVLALASEAVGRVQFSKKLAEGLGDRNGDGRVDHLDVWLTRGIKYLSDPKLHP